MKKVVFGLIALVTLASCGNDKYVVELSNGSKIVAIEKREIKYTIGDTVCVKDGVFHGDDWQIDDNGIMTNEAFFREWYDKDSVYHTTYRDYKIGRIIGKQ